MKDLLKYILENIVDNPEKVVVKQTTDDSGLVNLNASVAEADMGKVIGKGGKVINSIRQVIKIKAIKEGKRVNVNLTEPAATKSEPKKTQIKSQEEPKSKPETSKEKTDKGTTESSAK